MGFMERDDFSTPGETTSVMRTRARRFGARSDGEGLNPVSFHLLQECEESHPDSPCPVPTDPQVLCSLS